MSKREQGRKSLMSEPYDLTICIALAGGISFSAALSAREICIARKSFGHLQMAKSDGHSDCHIYNMLSARSVGTQFTSRVVIFPP